MTSGSASVRSVTRYGSASPPSVGCGCAARATIAFAVFRDDGYQFVFSYGSEYRAVELLSDLKFEREGRTGAGLAGHDDGAAVRRQDCPNWGDKLRII